MEIREYLKEQGIESTVILMDGMDGAFIGTTEIPNGPTLAVYSARYMVEENMRLNKWDFDQALEWFEYNQKGAYVGEGTPLIVDDLEFELLD